MPTSNGVYEADTGQQSLVSSMQDLRDRVEALEVNHSVSAVNTEVILEFIKILTEEVPAGRSLFNRAINRQKLHRLKEVVLPRRRAQLIEIMAETMPDPIREDFVNDEMKLLRQAIRSISHREHYEQKSAQNLRAILTSLFKHIHNARVRKMISPYKHQPKFSCNFRQISNRSGR